MKKAGGVCCVIPRFFFNTFYNKYDILAKISTDLYIFVWNNEVTTIAAKKSRQFRVGCRRISLKFGTRPYSNAK